ncbi:hypothetical protein RDI58_014717 [Solanum bulbocastanum]|uniref:Uncharacterized protein n=1 Tax=Solanum bulbocastanum TaxID=147425 RepID=A0AAN8YBA1_SOLBU
MPFKVSFYSWRIWKKRLPIGKVLISNKIFDYVVCWCCNQGAQESIEHLFVRCSDSKTMWKDFVADGACKDNSGPSSGAYCVRDAAGRFIYAKTKRLGYCTNLMVEIKAFRLGLEYCTSQNLVPLTMKTDSLSVKKILDGLWLAMKVRKIWRLMEGVPAVVEHMLIVKPMLTFKSYQEMQEQY